MDWNPEAEIQKLLDAGIPMSNRQWPPRLPYYVTAINISHPRRGPMYFTVNVRYLDS